MPLLDYSTSSVTTPPPRCASESEALATLTALSTPTRAPCYCRYSFGIMLIEMVHGSHRGLMQDYAKNGRRIENIAWRPAVLDDSREHYPEAVALAEACWSRDPRTRPTFSDIPVLLAEATMLETNAATGSSDKKKKAGSLAVGTLAADAAATTTATHGSTPPALTTAKVVVPVRRSAPNQADKLEHMFEQIKELRLMLAARDGELASLRSFTVSSFGASETDDSALESGMRWSTGNIDPSVRVIERP